MVMVTPSLREVAGYDKFYWPAQSEAAFRCVQHVESSVLNTLRLITLVWRSLRRDGEDLIFAQQMIAQARIVHLLHRDFLLD